MVNENEMVPPIPQDRSVEEPQVLSLDNICMIYGSWTSTSQFSGCRWVWIDSLGNVQLMETQNYIRRESVLHSEVEALHRRLRVCFSIRDARTLGQIARIFGTDCKDLIAMFKEPHIWPSFTAELERIETLQI
ncbi:hypothetical protein F2Q70_00031271 [Brassica cretica]|uniref:Uncharacterized protein n=1 Tax=Brassica cretica TaxID=69181 RepID=A0A8S9FBD7_BRACR|nr:hypothetical protein F2Q70_00031271 [Brassica cretica]KAF3590249.1 hypothetical protein DY000_02024333 [Brassica cretica]